MPSYSEIAKHRHTGASSAVKPRPIQIPSLRQTLHESDDWGDVVSLPLVKGWKPQPQPQPQPKPQPKPQPQQTTQNPNPLPFVQFKKEEAKQKRDKLAFEVSRRFANSQDKLEYNRLLYDHFSPEEFKEWCKHDLEYSYYEHCERISFISFFGQWVLYENGDSIGLFANCTEAQCHIQQLKKEQAFPFPIWAFLIRSTFERDYFEDYCVHIGKDAFHQRLKEESAASTSKSTVKTFPKLPASQPASPTLSTISSPTSPSPSEDDTSSVISLFSKVSEFFGTFCAMRQR